jgi:hypothetical protein
VFSRERSQNGVRRMTTSRLGDCLKCQGVHQQANGEYGAKN